MFDSRTNELKGSEWTGEAELWLDPKGNEVDVSKCTLAIEPGVLTYT